MRLCPAPTESVPAHPAVRCALPQVLDEPAAVQSDASVLALKLRQLGRGAGAGGALDVVGRVEHSADQAQRARSINAWVSSVTGGQLSEGLALDGVGCTHCT